MSTDSPDDVIHDLLPLVRRFCLGRYAVALGGSYAKGTDDPHSDVDIYLFSDDALPGSRRRELVREALGDAAEAVSWGGDGEFVEGGTDFLHHGRRVECWLRSAARVERAMESALQGQIGREYVAWTVMGFFSHVVLADVRALRIVEDPDGMLARWKAAVAEYPDPLRDAVLGRFMAEARLWPDNFHYRTAVERADVLYTSGIVQQVVHSLIQALFALNREYFPGEKQLARTIDKLPLKPAAFVPRAQALLCIGRDPTVAQLEAQRRELGALVDEVAALVADSAPLPSPGG